MALLVAVEAALFLDRLLFSCLISIIFFFDLLGGVFLVAGILPVAVVTVPVALVTAGLLKVREMHLPILMVRPPMTLSLRASWASSASFWFS